MRDTYEGFRAEFLAELRKTIGDQFTMDNVTPVLNALDNTATHFLVCDKAKKTSTQASTLLDTYIAIKTMEGLSKGTLEMYEQVLETFFARVKKCPQDVTANDIRMWLHNYGLERGIQNSTLDHYRALICRFFKWSADNGYLPYNVAQPIKAIHCEKKTRTALSQLELEHLRAAEMTLRDRAILEVFYSTGCRVSELIVLKRSDIDWDRKTVHLFGKGRKHRYSFINARCEVSLKMYLNSRADDDEHLFVTERSYMGKPKPLKKESVEKVIRQLSDAFGSKRITPHILRHTTATTAIQNGMPIEDVSKLLGHENVSTTMIYAKTSVDKVYCEHKRCII